MDWAVFASTLVLAAVTLGLVVFTRSLAVEAKRTREANERARMEAVRPRIALGVDNLGAGIGFVTISNLGAGPAVNVRGELRYEPLGEKRHIAFHTMPVGDKHQYLAPRDARGSMMRMDELSDVAPTVRLDGTMADVRGNELAFQTSIDLAAVWEITKESNRRLPPDHPKKAADELEKIRRTLEKIERLGDRAYYRLWPPEFG
jgi:hypothetical protein